MTKVASLVDKRMAARKAPVALKQTEVRVFTFADKNDLPKKLFLSFQQVIKLSEPKGNWWRNISYFVFRDVEEPNVSWMIPDCAALKDLASVFTENKVFSLEYLGLSKENHQHNFRVTLDSGEFFDTRTPKPRKKAAELAFI